MGKSFKITIIKLGSQPINIQGISLKVPGYKGSIGILNNRLPLIGTMELGLISIKCENGKNIYFATTGGFIEVENNVATLLCDSIITSEDLEDLPNRVKTAEKFYTKDISKFNDKEQRDYLIEMLNYKIKNQS